jgi:hypothetical protein
MIGWILRMSGTPGLVQHYLVRLHVEDLADELGGTGLAAAHRAPNASSTVATNSGRRIGDLANPTLATARRERMNRIGFMAGGYSRVC